MGPAVMLLALLEASTLLIIMDQGPAMRLRSLLGKCCCCSGDEW